MPDDEMPVSADPESPPPEPSSLPAPASTSEEPANAGCLALMLLGFAGVFLLPAVFLLGGAALVIPLIFLLLIVVVTPWINPTEKMAPKALWTGRLITFLGLSALLGIGMYVLFLRELPILQE